MPVVELGAVELQTLYLLKNIFKHFFLKYTQWQCILSYDNSTAMYKFLKTLHPVGIRTRDCLFSRWMRWPLCHAATGQNLVHFPMPWRESNPGDLYWWPLLHTARACHKYVFFHSTSLLCRVTRLGEFMPIGGLFTFRQVFEKIQKWHIFLGHDAIVLIKKWATFWAIFFTNSFGHTGSVWPKPWGSSNQFFSRVTRSVCEKVRL
jgi:hypothetical protein